MEFHEIDRLIRQATMGNYHGLFRAERNALRNKLGFLREQLLKAFSTADSDMATLLLDGLREFPRHQVAEAASTKLLALLN